MRNDDAFRMAVALDVPSPLVGEGREGGPKDRAPALTQTHFLSTPTPTPPHKGAGNI